MSKTEHPTDEMNPEETWRTIHNTMDQSRSSLYLAGTSTILLLWGGILAAGYIVQFVFSNLAAELVDENPWIYAVIWLSLVAVGFVGSSIIGNRAGQRLAKGDVARSAGFRVFLFWLAVTGAAFLIPAAAGMWNENAGTSIPGVAIGIIALGYTLFGIMHRIEIAVIGVLIAAAYYIPFHTLEGDALHLATSILMLAVVIGAAIWFRIRGIE